MSAIKKNNRIEKYLPHIFILLFTFLVYGNSIPNGYALDDLLVIKGNAFTKEGFGGIGDIFRYDSFTGFFGIQKKLVAGGRYRPLSIATFAIEYGLFKEFRPGFSHFINVLLYALTGVILYALLAILLLPQKIKKKPWYLGIPFITALLFIAHPLHTEVVANIKGRDEILALLFSILVLYYTVLYHQKKKGWHLAYAAISLFLGLLSKENTIMFLAVIPLTLYFFTKIPLRANLISVIPLFFSALLFLFIRYLALGYFVSTEIPRELLNNPFLDATAGQKAGTILLTLGMYIKLLFFPHPLTSDYYPYQVPLVEISDWRSLVPLIAYIFLAVVAILYFRKKHILSYGILFYLVTLFIVSNIVFPVGTFMNERFLYMPSVGFVLIVAWFLSEKVPSLLSRPSLSRNAVMLLTGLMLILYSAKTIARNPDWKDDFSLFSTDVLVSSNSTKCNTTAGGQYLEKAQAETDPALQEEYYNAAIKYLDRGLEIYPENRNCLLLRGNAKALYEKDYKGAIRLYFRMMEIGGEDANAITNTMMMLDKLDNASESSYKIHVLRQLDSIQPGNEKVSYRLGKIYGQVLGNLDSAEYYLNRSVSENPSYADPYKDLGVIYGMRGDFEKAVKVLKKAAELDPADQKVRENLALTYKILEQQKRGK